MQSKRTMLKPIVKARDKTFPIMIRVTEAQYFKMIGVLCDAVESHEWDTDFKTILREVLKN